MRIYSNPFEAFRETERDLFEMGIQVHPQTMQNKDVANDPNFLTVEVQGYGFKIACWAWNKVMEHTAVRYILTPPKAKKAIDAEPVLNYIAQEFQDRVGGVAMNPGNSWVWRKNLWNEFLDKNGKFHYTYSERITPQLSIILQELQKHPDTRQAIINIHSNIAPFPTTTCPPTDDSTYAVLPSQDLRNIGGAGRIPCSMYYQVMIRNNKIDLIYTMRSCDFLTHFPVDIMLALRMQSYVAGMLGKSIGNFTYFTGSLHAYKKDMQERGIF
jgi:thymidylate synthase